MLRDLRCPACKRLLCRLAGQGTTIEVKCGNRICNRIIVISSTGDAAERKPAPLTRAS